MKNSSTSNDLFRRQEEYSKLAFEKGNMLPRRYVFILTNLCNLRCTFCFQERKKREDRMHTDHWMHVLNQIPKGSRVTLTGGEPLVFQDFDKIFKKANELNETNIVTNGLLLSDDKIECLISEKNFKVLGISIDNIGNTNRDFKKSQWDKLVDQIHRFIKLREQRNHKSALDIKTVILDENIDDLFDIHKFTVEVLKADTHSLQMLKGAEIQHSDLMFDFKSIDKDYKAYKYKKFSKFVEQLNKIKNYDKQNDYKTYLHPSLIDLGQDRDFNESDLSYLNRESHDPKHFKVCTAPWSSVHINVDGNLFPCMAVSMGNVKNQKIKDIIFSDQFEKFKNTIRVNGTINGCNRCGWLRKISIT